MDELRTPEHSIGMKLASFQSQNKYCDIVLSTEDHTRIPVHRLVLSAAMDYFDAMLNNNMYEKSMPEILLKGVRGPVLKSLVDFCYTGQIQLNAENVEEILMAANMFRNDELEAKCSQYYTNIMSAENCLRAWFAAEQCGLIEKALGTYAVEYSLQFFTSIVRTQQFLALGVEHLFNYLNSSDLAVSCEEDIFHAIVKWIEYDVYERRSYYSGLLGAVRISKVTSAIVLDQISEYPQKIGLGLASVQELPSALTSNRATSLATILAVGGCRTCDDFFFQRENSVTLEEYNVESNSWTARTFIDEARLHCSAELIDGYLYLIGGYRTRPICTHLDEVSRYYLTTLEKSVLKPMIKKRSAFATVAVPGYIFALGGRNDYTSVEKYDIRNDEWVEVAPMRLRRMRVEVAFFMGQLYATGSSEGNDGSSAERYDLQANCWYRIADFNIKRFGHSCVVVSNNLYIVGGFNGSSFEPSIERYDHNIDKWTVIEMTLAVPRSSAEMVVHQNWIYLMGGSTDDEQPTKSVERINMKYNTREILAPMNRHRIRSRCFKL